MLFVHRIVAGGVLFAGLLAFDHFPADQFRDDAIDAVILVGGLLAGTADDQGRAGFVDQDGVDFVDDGKVVLGLHAILEAELHVVAEVIEPELVVGAVGDIGVVGGAALFVVQTVDDEADGEAEEFIDTAHPLGVAAGQVVVDGNDVHAFAAERIEVDGQRGDERFTLAGFHFGDVAPV